MPPRKAKRQFRREVQRQRAEHNRVGGQYQTPLTPERRGAIPVVGGRNQLSEREAKVESRRLQGEAKAHKYAMRRDKYDMQHMKRQQNLEYAGQHKEVYGIVPGTKYGIIGLISAGLGVLFSTLI
jgi:hypothetical protein